MGCLDVTNTWGGGGGGGGPGLIKYFRITKNDELFSLAIHGQGKLSVRFFLSQVKLLIVGNFRH